MSHSVSDEPGYYVWTVQGADITEQLPLRGLPPSPSATSLARCSFPFYSVDLAPTASLFFAPCPYPCTGPKLQV